MDKATVTASHLRTNLSTCLDAAARGQIITITRNTTDRPTAMLVPVDLWERLTTISVQELADGHGVDVDEVGALVRRLVADQGESSVVARRHTLPGPTLLTSEAAASIAYALETRIPSEP
jgi:prevent-host-death family protein